MTNASRLLWCAVVPWMLSAQSLPPLGEPLLNANGQNSRFTGVASVRYGAACSGVFFAPSAGPAGPAYVLSNGHCISLLGTNEVVLDRAGQGEVTFFAFADIPASQRLRVPIRRVAYATQKGLDLSIIELSATSAELIARGVHALRPAAVPPRPGDPIEVAGIPVTGVPDAERVIRLSRCTAGRTVQLLEGRWHTYDAVSDGCTSIRGGSSGSPVVDVNGELAGLIFTTTWGESPLAACAINRPCEVTSTGTISPDETSYSVPVAGLASCFNSEGRFEVSLPACTLDPGKQFNLTGYPLSAVNPNQPGAISQRPPQTSWNTRVAGPFAFVSYKIGPVEATDCRSAEGYSMPVRVETSTLINDPFPRSDTRLVLCAIGGDSPVVDASWQPFRFTSQARVVIDTIPPVATPSANITPGDPYIVLFEYLATEIAFYQYKAGPPGATDCSDAEGYRAFVQRLFLSRAGEPYQICAIPLDSAENRGKPWGFIVNQIGFQNAASRVPTSSVLLPGATTAMTGDFPSLPTASLATEAGQAAVGVARRDRGEIWLSLPDMAPARPAILRLSDPSGSLSFSLEAARGAPGIYTIDGSGRGAPAGYFVRPDGTLQFLSVPLHLDPAGDTIIDVYATAILSPALSATLGGRPIEVVTAGSDRVRLRIPAGFPLRGELDLLLQAGPLVSNTARIAIQ